MSAFFEKQIWHLLGAALLLLVAREAATSPDVLTGSWLGFSSAVWYWAGIWFAIGHQLFVMLVWRSQLHFGWITGRFGARGFIYYARGFAFFSFARIFFLIGLAIANRGTLPGDRLLFNLLGLVFLALVVWLMVSVLRYFSVHRALGADHFEEKYRQMGLVTGGIFTYINNGMYIVGLLFLWLPGLFLAAKGALLVGLFGHAYIWVHYFTTEKPDMRRIYGA